MRPRATIRGLAGVLFPLLLAASFDVLAQTAAPSEAGRTSQLSAERAFWESIDQASPVELRLYLEKFPEGLYAVLAKRRLVDLEEAVRRAKAEAEETLRIERAREARRKELEAESSKAQAQREAQATTPTAATPGVKGLPEGEFEFAVGQNWKYEIREASTQKFLRSMFWEVTATDAGRIRINRMRGISRDGRVFHDGTHQYDPYIQVLELPLHPDKRWRSQYTARPRAGGGAVRWDVSYRVVGNETLQLASGTFDCVRVEATGTYSSAGGSGTLKTIHWHAHKLGQFARYERTVQPNGASLPSVHERWELVEANLLPKTAVRP